MEIPDLAVSRPHCSISFVENQFTLSDCDSANGTYVNDERLAVPRILREGDRIGIGAHQFVFRRGSSGQGQQVEFDDLSLVSNSTVRLPIDRAEFAHSSDERASRDLNCLIRLAETMKTASDLESVQRELLSTIFAIAPADRGVVLVIENGIDDLRVAVGIERQAPLECRPVTISRTVAVRALQEKTAVLMNDIRPESNPAASLKNRAVRALAAIPFVVDGRAIGLLYVETSGAFDDSHFQTFLAAAGIASLAIANVDRVASLKAVNCDLLHAIQSNQVMIGDSAPMRQLCLTMSRIARTETTVLILGETGTGKELAARQIHMASSRASGPLVAINCAVLSDQLLESELFGHERGAFTGAVVQKRGKLEIAHGGTLFLDEIGELALPVQAKLLRVIQEREFERVGGLRPIAADVRVIAATNRDLAREVEIGRFRADLYTA